MSVETATTEAITSAWRVESARLVGALTRMTRDVELAEDLAQDALVAALEQWPADGVPTNPAAWLMTTAKRRGVDYFRRSDNLRSKTEELGRALSGEEQQVPDLDAQVDHIEDDVLRLIFLSCHPCLTPDSRAALTLRLVGGLTTSEIARGFLDSEPAMGQRISRAKKTLSQARASFDLPTGADRDKRLDDVMSVIYLIFNEGYDASSGDSLLRRELSGEAIRLGSVLLSLMPDEPEVLGLVALMLLHDARRDARVGPNGELILLDDQDRARWDRARIEEGKALLERAFRMRRVGRYQLEASIAALHDEAATPAATDWPQIAVLYGELANRAPSAVVELNRAVAVAMASGPESGLSLIEDLAASGRLDEYPYLHAARADLLRRLDRPAEAAVAYARARELTANAAEQAFLDRRIEEVAGPGGADRGR